MCGASFAETSVSSGYFRLSMDDAQVEQKYSKLQNVIVAGIKLSEECECKVTINRPDITISWVQTSLPLITKTMSWDAPTQRVNNDPLDASEIDHYIISYWRNGDTEQYITISGSNQERVVEGLSPGVWSFQIMTVDTDDLPSEWSELVEVSI